MNKAGGKQLYTVDGDLNTLYIFIGETDFFHLLGELDTGIRTIFSNFIDYFYHIGLVDLILVSITILCMINALVSMIYLCKLNKKVKKIETIPVSKKIFQGITKKLKRKRPLVINLEHSNKQSSSNKLIKKSKEQEGKCRKQEFH